MEQFFATIAFGLVSALAIIAYRHPAGYARIHYWLLALIMVGYLMAMTWDMALLEALNQLREADADPINAREAIGGIRLSILVVSSAFFAAFLYLFILSILPTVLGLGEKEQEQKNGKKK